MAACPGFRPAKPDGRFPMARFTLPLALVLLAAHAFAENMAILEKGGILTDARGLTLYTFDQDKDGMSSCHDACAANWPPLLAEAGAMADAEYGLTDRSDGTKLWTWKGMPLDPPAGPCRRRLQADRRQAASRRCEPGRAVVLRGRSAPQAGTVHHPQRDGRARPCLRQGTRAPGFLVVDGGLGCALAGDLPRETLRRPAISAYHGLTET